MKNNRFFKLNSLLAIVTITAGLAFSTNGFCMKKKENVSLWVDDFFKMEEEENVSWVDALVKNDLDLDEQLFEVIKQNDAKAVSELIKNGANVNAKNNYGMTALYYACYIQNPEIVRLLLEFGAIESINKADNDGNTPLYCACRFNNLEIVRLLLENGANIEQDALTAIGLKLHYQPTQEAQQIQATLNLTQRFDKWEKTGEWFDLTAQEKQNEGLCEFRDRLLQSKRKEIINAPKKGIANILTQDQLSRLDDCQISCCSKEETELQKELKQRELEEEEEKNELLLKIVMFTAKKIDLKEICN